MTEQTFNRLRAMKPLDQWTDAELTAEGTTRAEFAACSRRIAERIVWMRDHVWRYRWKKTGVQWLDRATMVLTPKPCARLAGAGAMRPRERRSVGGVLRRGPPEDDPDDEPPRRPEPQARAGVVRSGERRSS